MSLLEVNDIRKSFGRHRAGREVRAVDGVSLTLDRGETLGIAGESGCGKSTLARLALRLIEPSGGAIRFNGQEITHLSGRALLPTRRRLQAVFQDPLASFNPGMSIGAIMREPFETHRLSPQGGIDARSRALLHSVGLDRIDLARRPGEFSGGQLQRIAIARALALEPEVIVADEPTSALDSSIQAQIVNVMLDIQRSHGVAYMIISHDLDMLGHMADRLAIMYLGTIVETGPGPALMDEPLHPYTQALLSAAPSWRARRDRSWRRVLLPGDPPNPANIPPGCRFHPRCPLARELCRTEVPPLRSGTGTGHMVACHLAPEETRASGIAVARSRVAVRRYASPSLAGATAT